MEYPGLLSGSATEQLSSLFVTHLTFEFGPLGRE